ncbi:ATP-dependent helicase [Plasmodium gonderi]|uniref:ATP-dependent RNA helicase n=1 Tax=Plasmodium gonderi TaxID=77519 RepID=A0A1Y1JM97_PLAGO|nr:ATP-dependent helicase [Plasmodium gonderi]GAW81513.1 ATP-dependent helicase [Plasmodium gonderi]
MFFAPVLSFFFFFFSFLKLINTFNINKLVNASFSFNKGILQNVRTGEGKIIFSKNLQRHYNHFSPPPVEYFPCKNEIQNDKDGGIFFKKDQTFSKLLVHPTLVEELNKNNIITPSVIQFDLLQYYNKNSQNMKNVIIGAENGIGKTLSYIILVLNHILKQRPKDDKISVLIFQYSGLLRRQCHDVVRRLSRNVKVKINILNKEDPIDLNKNKNLILITSPERFVTHMKENQEAVATFLQSLNFFIMDEVDIMFDNPIIKYMKRLYEQMNKLKNTKCVSILTSSTLCNKGKKSVYQNIKKYVKDAVFIKTNYLHNIHPFINYNFINLPVYNIKEKVKAIKNILSKENHKKVLIFCNTVSNCNNAFSLLKSHFDDIFSFNSSLKKEDQFIILDHFKNSEKSILVSTDIIHRGVDVKGITHLFHFDAPTNAVIYTHRNGRISRGASTGGNIYLFNNSENLVTNKIYQLHKNNVKFEDIFSRKRSLRKNYKRDLKKKIEER